MITLGKIISTELDNIKRRLVKIQLFGKSDIQTPKEGMPFGLDSNPTKDMIALYAESKEKGKAYIIGYLVKNQKAEVGETRLFATDAQGNEQGYAWLKKDGTLELLGNTNFAVKYNELKIELDALKKSHNDLLTEYKAHIHPTNISAIVVSPTVSTQIPNTSDFSKAKNAKIKTND